MTPLLVLTIASVVWWYMRGLSTLTRGIGAGAAAMVALVAAWLLGRAAGKPALQTLAVILTLALAVAAKLAWHCSRLCSAVAFVPLALAGKPLIMSCHVLFLFGPQAPSLPAEQLRSRAAALLQHGAGAACWHAAHPDALMLVPLCKAAFVGTVSFAASSAFTCLPSYCTPDDVWAVGLVSLLAAWAGTLVSSLAFRCLAWAVLPHRMYTAVSERGVLSGEFWAARLWVTDRRLNDAFQLENRTLLLGGRAGCLSRRAPRASCRRGAGARGLGLGPAQIPGRRRCQGCRRAARLGLLPLLFHASAPCTFGKRSAPSS